MEGVALLISVLSLTTASITLNQVLDSKLPEIIVEVTDGKRYNLLTLVVKNVGKMTAYNIKIKFPEKPLVRYYNENDNEEFNILTYAALAQNNELVIALGGPMYFDKLKDEDLIHEVIVSFHTSRNGWFINKYKTNSTIDVSAYRKTLISPSEEISAYKKVPDELNIIGKNLSTIAEELTRPRREEEHKRRMKQKSSDK